MKKALITALVLTTAFVILICIISDRIPDMGVNTLYDRVGIVQDEARINKTIKGIYKDSGIFVSIYVDHMVDREEAVNVIESLVDSAYSPENCLFILYFDTGITYEYFYAPGEAVVKQLSQDDLKLIFDTTAQDYEEFGGEEVLYRTLEKIRQSI